MGGAGCALLLGAGFGGCGGSGGTPRADAATEGGGGRADGGSDGGAGTVDAGPEAGSDAGADAGSPGSAPGPRALLERRSPSLEELAARRFDELLVGWAEDLSPPRGTRFPRRLTLDLTPAAARPTPARLCLRWGVMTSGIMTLPSPKWSAELLGRETLGGSRRVPVQGCGSQPDAADIYGCEPVCWKKEGRSRPLVARSGPPRSAAEVDALVARLGREGPDGVPPVRLLHPFMVAYPCDADGRPQVETDRAAILTSQFSTTDNGWKWAEAFQASGVAGDNDVQGAEERWQQAWELAARRRAFVMWVGDVSFPRRWYPAAERTEDNPFGIRCGEGLPERDSPLLGDPDWGWDLTGWYEANSFTGYQFFALNVAAAAAPERPLPDALLATFSAMPYIRALGSAATFLQRFAEEVTPGAPVPGRFSVAGASKGGMGCLYATLADPRIEHGACKVFDALDAATPVDMMHRMVTDWGICRPGGLRADGCATGNFTGFLGPQLLPLLEAEGAAADSFRAVWDLGTVLPALDRAAPEARLFLLNGYPDFHWSLGNNDEMWVERPPPADQLWLVHRINADHGMHHLAPDDAPEGIPPRAWSHGVDEAIAYRAFFEDRAPLQVRFLEPPRREGDRIVARARVTPPSAVRGAQAWIAAGTDRDFSFCTGIELGAEAVMCRGEFFCQTKAAVTGPGCPGRHLGGSCAWKDGLDGAGLSRDQRRLVLGAFAAANPLPTRPPSGHFCWWRWAEGGPSARPAWQQCIAPRSTLSGAPSPDALDLSSWSLPDGPQMGVREYLQSGETFAEVLLRAMRGTYAELPRGDAEPGLAGRDPSRTPLPPTYRFAAFGAARHEDVLRDAGFVDPYARDETGEYRHWAAGFFVPRPVVLQDDGTVELSWSIPAGSAVDHFAVTLEVWSAPRDGLPDVVYTPVLTVAPSPDPSVRSCGG